MSRILYFTNGMASTLHTGLELARRLSGAGHDVVYACSAEVASRVREHGYQVETLQDDARWRDRLAELERPRLTDWSRLGSWWRDRKELRSASIRSDETARVIERVAPDLLLIDIEMHATIIRAARFGLPTLLPIVWFSIFRDRRLPPLHTSLRPEDGAVAIRTAWLRLALLEELLRWRGRLSLRRSVRPAFSDTMDLSDLRAIARESDYDLDARTDRSQWLRPHVYRDHLVLSFNAWEAELPHEAHAQLRYVGPMVDRSRRESQQHAISVSRWKKFLEDRETDGSERPLVYCSLGSHWSADRSFLRNVVDVFRRRAEWDLVLGLGGKLEAQDLAALPSNVLALDWAPQLQVLAHADCAITHGGITTINECIACGVPLVVYSTKHVDQNGCATRVEFHGLGIAADKDRDGSADIEANVESILRDATIQERVASMQSVFRSYEERGEAVRIVEELLRP